MNPEKRESQFNVMRKTMVGVLGLVTTASIVGSSVDCEPSTNDVNGIGTEKNNRIFGCVKWDRIRNTLYDGVYWGVDESVPSLGHVLSFETVCYIIVPSTTGYLRPINED